MASVISIPPDLFVYIPGYTMQRINTAYPVGGISLVKDTLEYNLGIITGSLPVGSDERFSPVGGCHWWNRCGCDR